MPACRAADMLRSARRSGAGITPNEEEDMDWFNRLTGFKEATYADTQARLEVDGTLLRSKVNGTAYGIGTFEMAALADLRAQVAAGSGAAGRLRASIVQGDVGAMHQEPEFAGAVFQVASQFNALEMVGPTVTPEDGVSRYEHDRTQGPACAMAAGAATIFRNYFVPVGDQTGQTATRQLDGIADLGAALSEALGRPVADLWAMRNGYSMCTRAGLDLIAEHLRSASTGQIDALAGMLRVGIHRDVEVTDAPTLPGPRVTQVFASALPVAYGRVPARHWQPFAQLVLDAAYEATLLAAVINARRGTSSTVLLTLLGGGAFGNDDAWIHAAIQRAAAKVQAFDLDLRLVRYGRPAAGLRALVQRLQAA